MERISHRIADYLVKKGTVDREYAEVYQYGYRMLIQGVVQVSCILIFGIILHQLPLTILFLIVFICLRYYTGGYHADTRIGCILVTICCYLGILLFARLLAVYFSDRLWPFLLLTEIVYVAIYIEEAPVEHRNKKTTPAQRRNNRKKGGIVSVVCLIAAGLAYLWLREAAAVILLTMLTVAVSMLKTSRKQKQSLDSDKH